MLKRIKHKFMMEGSEFQKVFTASQMCVGFIDIMNRTTFHFVLLSSKLRDNSLIGLKKCSCHQTQF